MCFHDHPEGMLIDVRVQPKSAQNAIVGLHDGALKIKLNAPPVEGKANKAVIKVLEKSLKLAKGSVSIESGFTSCNKIVEINNYDEDIINQQLNKL